MSNEMKLILPKMIIKLKALIRDYIPIGRLSYSQEGEDLVLNRILAELKITSGYYVDIGAHHPILYSNTYFFYRRGWHGINVDALPGTKKLFDRMRPRDINIECGVGSKAEVLKYYLFNVAALNTFSEQEAKKKDTPPYRLVNTLEIPVVTLSKLLDDHLPDGMPIDFMTIDAEGFDHEVVISNDWKRYRPRVLLVELLNTDIQNLNSNRTAQVLFQHNYRIMAKSFNTFFFVASECFPQHA